MLFYLIEELLISLHAEDDQVAVAVFGQEDGLAALVGQAGDLREPAAQVGDGADIGHGVCLLSLVRQNG